MNSQFYLRSFCLLPTVLICLDALDRIFPMNFVVMLLSLTAVCLFTGLRSPRRGDWLLAVLMPLSVFAALFLTNLLTDGECKVMFDFLQSLKQSTRPEFLIVYLCLGAVTLAASFRRRETT